MYVQRAARSSRGLLMSGGAASSSRVVIEAKAERGEAPFGLFGVCVCQSACTRAQRFASHDMQV